MMFLPSSDDNSPAIDWLRLLDFLQVTIVPATTYLYFFYAPSRWQTDHASLLRQILILYLVRDFLLSAGFFLRARTSLSLFLSRYGSFLPRRRSFRRRLSLYTRHLLWSRQLGRLHLRVTVPVRRYFCGHLETSR